MTCLLVGLGNPGEKYRNTRHNAGWLVLEYFKKEKNFSEWRNEKMAKGKISDGEVAGQDVTILLPNTFMNRSGESVSKLIRDPKDALHMIVVHDEIDLPIGEIKIAHGKGAGGHNGVQSIINHIHTKDFTRVRIGVSPLNWFGRMKKPLGKDAVTKYLLSNFSKRDEDKLSEVYETTAKILETIVEKGHLEAMNEWNEG